MWRRIASAAMVLLGMTTVAARPASAATITFELNTLVAGSPVQGDQVTATLTFEDFAAHIVRLTVASSLNHTGEFISDIAEEGHRTVKLCNSGARPGKVVIGPGMAEGLGCSGSQKASWIGNP
jgi:hypothetical protein